MAVHGLLAGAHSLAHSLTHLTHSLTHSPMSQLRAPLPHCLDLVADKQLRLGAEMAAER